MLSNLVLGEAYFWKAFSSCDLELRFDKINSRDLFGDCVFYLTIEC